MKPFLLISGGLLTLLNAAVLFYPDPSAQLGVTALSGLTGLGLLVASLRGGEAKTAAPVPAPAVADREAPAPARGEAEVVAFLALLQEKGRLVDFVQEEISGASDEQVGAAARVIHEGCRKVIHEYFEIAPIRTEAEGTPLQLGEGYDTAAHRLIGSVPDRPPYRGRLVHPGWETRSVKLPRVHGTDAEGGRRWPVIAPVEVEIN